MNKYLSVLMVAVIVLVMMMVMAGSGLAAGDKMRGENAVGPAYQNGECPFKG